MKNLIYTREINHLSSALKRSGSGGKKNISLFEIDFGASLSADQSPYQKLLNKLSILKRKLSEDGITGGLREILDPFLGIIRSEEVSGPITGLALDSVNKFIKYKYISVDIDEDVEELSYLVDSIADAVTHAR